MSSFRQDCERARGQSEVGEYRESISLGGHLTKGEQRNNGDYQGTGLDAVEWQLDRYAEAVGSEAVRISGRVRSIAAVYLEMTNSAPAPGTQRMAPHLKALDTTARTRTPAEQVDWAQPWSPEPSTTRRSAFPDLRFLLPQTTDQRAVPRYCETHPSGHEFSVRLRRPLAH